MLTAHLSIISIDLFMGEWKMQSIATWVFDLDGTLVEAMPLQHVIKKVADMSGRPFETLFEEYRTNYTGVAAMKKYHQSLVAAEDHSTIDALYAEWEASQTAPQLLDGARELLESLKSSGRRLVLWSKGSPQQQENKLRAVGLYELFDERLVTTAKGRPETVEQRLLPAVQGRWAMVGDSYEQDVLPALPFAHVVYWIYGGWANSLAAPKSWEPHERLQRIADIGELHLMRRSS